MNYGMGLFRDFQAREAVSMYHQYVDTTLHLSYAFNSSFFVHQIVPYHSLRSAAVKFGEVAIFEIRISEIINLNGFISMIYQTNSLLYSARKSI